MSGKRGQDPFPPRKGVLTPFLFLAPALAHLALFSLGPVAYAFWISLHRWRILSHEQEFVGLANYARLFAEGGAFWAAALRTAWFAVLSVPAGMAVALAVALLLHRKLRGSAFFRTALFLPVVTSTVAVAMAWEWLLHPDFGLANHLLRSVGLDGPRWFQDRRFALPAVAAFWIWKGLGLQVVILLAGLEGVPRELIEAAEVDEAPPLRRFLRITLPLLRPTILFLAVTGAISAFQLFTPVFLLTQGGPVRATDLAGYHVFRSAFFYFRLGAAAAQAFVLALLVLGLTALQIRLLRRRAAVREVG